MSNEASIRTVKADGQAIQRLRVAKGWNVADLAKKAKCSKCSLKTVENVERGASVYLFTLGRIAEALGIECGELLKSATPPAATPPKERRFEVQIKLLIPYEEFDQSEQLGSLIDVLKRLILMGGGGDINVVAVGHGSTLITLDMNEEDAESFILTFVKGYFNERIKDTLDAWDVSGLKLPDSKDFTSSSALLKLIAELYEPPYREAILRRPVIVTQAQPATKPVDVDS